MVQCFITHAAQVGRLERIEVNSEEADIRFKALNRTMNSMS